MPPGHLGRIGLDARRGALVGVAPSTLTADLSFAAAILSEVKGDRARIHSWSDVTQLARMSVGGFYPGSRRAERESGWFGG